MRRFLPKRPSRFSWSAVLLLVLGLAGCAALSYLRAHVTGTLRVDQVPLSPGQAFLGFGLFGTFALISAWSYLSVLRCERLPSLPQLLGGALLIHLAAAATLPLTSNDLFSNLCYGHMAALGHDPYVSTPDMLDARDPFAALVGLRWRHQIEVYGPVASALSRLIGRLPTVTSALVAFKATFALLSLAVVLVAYAACRAHPSRRDGQAAFVFLAWNPLLAWELTAQAHNDVLLVLGMVGFVWAALRDRLWLGVIFLALAAYAKFAALPVLGLVLCVVARRSKVRALLMTLSVVVTGALLVLPFHDGLAPLEGALSAFRGEPTRVANSFAALLFTLTQPLGTAVQEAIVRLYGAGALAVLAALALRAALRVRTLDDVVHESLLFLLAYDLLAASWFQPWYVTWLFPLALAHRDARMRWLVGVYGVLNFVQYAIALDPLTTLAMNAAVLRGLYRLLRHRVEPELAVVRSAP